MLSLIPILKPSTVGGGGGGGGGAFPQTPVLDDFNQPDGPVAAHWTPGIDGSPGTFKIVGNEAGITDGAFSSVYWNTTNFGPNVEAYLTLRGNTNSGYRVYTRLLNPGISHSGYFMQMWNAGEVFSIYRVDSGSVSAPLVSASLAAVAGDSFGMSAVGNLLTMYFKTAAGVWTPLDSVVDSTYSGAGRIGMAAFEQLTLKVDDFGGGTI